MKTLHLTVLLLLAAAVALGQPVIQVGNLNPPVPPAVPDLHFGQTSYAYLVYPPDQGNCTKGGFKLETLHMYLELTAAQVPVTFDAAAVLREAVWDPGQNGWVPGPPLCGGPLWTFTFDDPGLYVIDLPLDDSCGCEVFDMFYFLSVDFPTFFEADLPVDGLPQEGIVFRNTSGFWEDMFGLGKTATGKVIIWGDLVCCEPVGNDTSTWSGIKSLYE